MKDGQEIVLDKSNINIRYEPHSPASFGKKTKLPWQYCRICGLVYLNNDLTHKAIKKGHEAYDE